MAARRHAAFYFAGLIPYAAHVVSKAADPTSLVSLNRCLELYANVFVFWIFFEYKPNLI